MSDDLHSLAAHSVRELPDPEPKGVEVMPELFLWIDANVDDLIAAPLKNGISDRSDFGFKKYKQRLMTGDGRPDEVEALQEILDAIHYAYKAKMNKTNLRVLSPYVEILLKLVNGD